MNSPLPATDAPVSPAPFKIVIVYENLTAGIRAQETVERLGKQMNTEAGVSVALWKFDVLEYPSMQEQAAQDAADADMLIISTGINTLPPVSVRDWLEHVLPVARQQNPRAGIIEVRCALVALLNQEDQNRVTWGSQNNVRDYLEQIAINQGMDFFCKHEETTPEAGSVAPKQNFPASPLMFLDESFTPDVGWRRWGIND